MSIAAYKALLEMAAEPVPVTAEPMVLVSGTTYQVTDPARRVLDPGAPVVVSVGGSPADPADYVVDFLFGRVIFSTAPGGAVTINAEFLPPARLATTRSFNISVTRASLDNTGMAPETLSRSKIMGLKDCTISVDVLEDQPLFQEYTFGTATVELVDIFAGAVSPLVFSLSLPGLAFRAFVKLQEHSVSGELEGLLETSLNYEATSRNGVAYASLVS